MQKLKTILLLVLALLLLSIQYLPSVYNFSNPSSQAQQFQEVLHHKEQVVETKLKLIHELHHEDQLSQLNQVLLKDFKLHGFSYFILIDNQIEFWSEDATSIEAQQLLSNNKLVESGHALHEKISFQKGDTSYVGLILIQYNYPYQNRFLSNDFQEDFQLSALEKIMTTDEGDVKINGQNGETLFDLKLKKQNTASENFTTLIGLLGGLSLLLLLHYFPLLFKTSPQRTALIAIAWGVVIRIFAFIALPPIWASWKVFQSEYFAFSEWVPSLGDFMLHILLLFYIVSLLPKAAKRIKSKYYFSVLIFVALLLSVYSIELIQDSVLNSSIRFNLNRLFQLSFLSYLNFGAFAILLFSALALLSQGVSGLLKHLKLSQSIFLSAGIAIIGLLFHAGMFDFHLLHLWIVLPLALLVFHHKRSKSRSVGVPIALLLILSLTTAYAIYDVAFQKEAQKREMLLSKLAEEKDPIAEYLFSDVQTAMRSDDKLKSYLKNFWQNQEEAEQYIQNKFFQGYWEKYKMVFTPCLPEDSLYINPENVYAGCSDYFQSKIRREGEQISSNNLFQLRNFPGRIEYLAEVLIPVDSFNYTLYIEMLSNNFNENEGYPELLLDAKSQGDNLSLLNYSFAVYDEGELIYHFGDYNYSRKLRITELAPTAFYQTRSEESEHLLYQKDQKTTLVLSRPLPTLLNFLTYWAYLFVIYSLLFFVISAVVRTFPFYFRFPFTDFSAKIQFFLVSSLLVALVLFGVGTTYYIQKQYQQKNFKNLSEKVRSVNLELEQKIGTEEFMSEQLQSYINGLLVKFSNVFYSDINLYDRQGNLYATSRPEVFDKGLKSKRMNPEAYEALILNNKSEWVQEESIGEMKYLSAYIPFKNYNNEVLAYLNLPYFSKQGELEQEISTFLVSTINIYVGIFTLALLVSVLLINQLSKPLLMIRKQIGKLKLGSSVELIDWESKDEIGALVKEYNRIAIELNESAEQLAQTEREGAWREMAKQVAHEIKNPLTPMKLSIQHLQRAYDSGEEIDKDRIKRTTQNLIEQIDTLSNIANAFSTFAKMPEKELRETDLVPALHSAIALYENEVEIVFENDLKVDSALIMGDKDQLLRLFNNLIKNAVHAIEENDEGRINIRLYESEKQYKISITDNGAGIPQEQQSRIFEPNFTTKSSGTGLGLAMCKNIVNHLQAKISFESEDGKGTVFYLEFEKT
jgi:signal transduction histidine kinase